MHLSDLRKRRKVKYIVMVVGICACFGLAFEGRYTTNTLLLTRYVDVSETQVSSRDYIKNYKATNTSVFRTAESSEKIRQDSLYSVGGIGNFTFTSNDSSEFVYSAHFDDRLKLIKIIGFKRRGGLNKPPPVRRCRTKVSNNVYSSPMAVYYNVSALFPRVGLLYDSFVWSCKTQHVEIPETVGIIDESVNLGAAVAELKVLYSPPVEQSDEFGICVKPLVKNYGNLFQLTEFIETHRVFGVTKFIFYDYQHDKTIDAALKLYVQEGLVEVHRWAVPVPITELHAFGQKSAQQHCLLAYTNRIKYLAFLDLDEIIVPRGGAKKWSDVVRAAKMTGTGSEGGYVVLSTLFPMETLEVRTAFASNASVTQFKMASLLKYKRSPAMAVGVWSKPLVEVVKADIIEIHIVRQMMLNYTSVILHPDIAMVHHYRTSYNVPYNFINDTSILPFAEQIFSAVSKAFTRLSSKYN